MLAVARAGTRRYTNLEIHKEVIMLCPRVVLIAALSLLALSACDRAKAPIVEGGPSADTLAPLDSLTDTTASDTTAPDVGAPDTAGPGPDTHMVGDVQWPPTCCDVDADCAEGKICVGAGAGVQGQCRPDGCYGPEGCAEHFICVGYEVCSCTDDCLSMRGSCRPQDAGCCGPDLDCPAGTQCVAEGPEGWGTCAPVPPKEGKFWSDADCVAGQGCDGAQLCPCDADCDMWNEFGWCMDAGLQECVQKHSGCGCEEGCADGFWAVAYYPDGAGPFPADFWPSQEILDAAVAWYECSICTCEERWHIKVDGVWIDDLEEHVDGFCEFLIEYQESCGDCLESWEGGCC